MKELLKLQELDLKIEACLKSEKEVPKKRDKLEIQKKRLHDELEELRKEYKDLQKKQHSLEVDIDQLQTKMKKYEQQLMTVKKNEEYQALDKEINDIKEKEIPKKEEELLNVMEKVEEAKLRLTEDEKRIQGELKKIEEEFKVIEKELTATIQEREKLENERMRQVQLVDSELLAHYERFRSRRKTSKGVVPLRGDYCSGCNMQVPAQLVNEVLGGKIKTCNHCGRILYDPQVVNKVTA